MFSLACENGFQADSTSFNQLQSSRTYTDRPLVSRMQQLLKESSCVHDGEAG